MKRKAWFCYELDQANQPVPCIYYDEPPLRSHGKRRIVAEFTLNDIEVTMSFASLCVIYPYKESIDNSNAVVIPSKQEKQDMSHPVSGYLTSQGKFFETSAEAELYEARYILNKATTQAVMDIGVRGEPEIAAAVDAIVSFINQNDELINNYLFARRILGSQSSPNGLDGSAETNLPSDDPSLRDTSSGELASPPTTETVPSTAGAVSE